MGERCCWWWWEEKGDTYQSSFAFRPSPFSLRVFRMNANPVYKKGLHLILFELGCATWLIMNNKLALHNGSDCTEENNTLIYFLVRK